MLVDAHCHLWAFKQREVAGFSNIRIVAVSEDYESSATTIRLSKRFGNVVPAVGLHPWEVRSHGVGEAERIAEMGVRNGVRVLGEVGLDKRYHRDVYGLQLRVFKVFVRYAEEHGLALNIHALDAWRDVVEILEGSDVPSALIHWYTGPLDLIDRIKGRGLFITVNPAVAIQRKHRRVVEAAPLDIMLTESDGPYNYHGVVLKPTMVPEALKAIAEIKGLEVGEVERVVERNLRRFLLEG